MILRKILKHVTSDLLGDTINNQSRILEQIDKDPDIWSAGFCGHAPFLANNPTDPVAYDFAFVMGCIYQEENALGKRFLEGLYKQLKGKLRASS